MRVVTTAITIFTEVLLSLWVPLTAAVEMAATRSDAPPWPMALSWRESTDVDANESGANGGGLEGSGGGATPQITTTSSIAASPR